jgi:hypothetical protein
MGRGFRLFREGSMRISFLVVLLFPLAAFSAMAASTGSSTGAKTIKIKDEILRTCAGFPYAPTLAMDAKTATIDDMKDAKGAVDTYLLEVANYEKCLISLGKSLDGKITAKDSDFIISVINRALDERDVLAIEFNKLVDEYNAANGIKPKTAKPAAKTTKPAEPKPAPASN